jgi:NADPH-dependent glutamate synthase beta subunit-like oxidoreductase
MRKPYAITLDVGSSLANHTGTWRTQRPVYVQRLPPCNAACPAGENIQQWLFHAEEGQYERAWRALVRDNPLPAIMGRVCYHPCESACNRGQLDESVGINAVERFLGDEANRRGWQFDPVDADSGRQVLVIGSGPAGLAAAYHLRRLGHRVVIAEAEQAPGGMMRFGIPQYRLPRATLDADIQRIIDLGGIDLRLGERVDDVDAYMRDGGFDACFLGVGSQIGKRAYIPAGDARRITDAVSLLHSVENREPPLLGRHVVVYGGGNTAVDVARTARRLGAEESVIVYRRTRERMPAHADEVREAIEEGVKLKWLSTITAADGETITVEKMELDEQGFPQPTGEYETMPADSVVLALGQDVDLGLLERIEGIGITRGAVEVDDTQMTARPGLFAGGDLVGGAKTVTVAVGHGKHAARAIDAWLRDESYQRPAKNEQARFDMLNTWYYSDAPKTIRPVLDIIRRQSTFDEVVGSLDEANALYEARRCMSCGNCFECDTCYGVCPDNAVEKLGPGKGFAFNYDYCKGCGLCVAECPCGAIRVEPEPD